MAFVGGIWRCGVGVLEWVVFVMLVGVASRLFESIFWTSRSPGPGGFDFFLESRIRVAVQEVHMGPQFFFLIHVLLLMGCRGGHSAGGFRRRGISPGAVLCKFVIC